MSSVEDHPSPQGQLAPGTVLVDHVERIRRLEGRSQAFTDGDWTAPGAYSNDWVDGATLNLLSGEPGVSFVLTGNGWCGMRGRVSAGKEGLPAFTLPSEFQPPADVWFTGDVSNGGIVAGGGGEKYFVPGMVGRILVRANGDVVPFMGGGGFQVYRRKLQDTFGSGPSPLGSPLWINEGGNNFVNLAAGGLGLAAPGVGTPGALFLGTGPWMDCELSAIVGSTVPDKIAFGLRCQYPYDPTVVSYPNGYWAILDMAAGGSLVLFTQTNLGQVDGPFTFNGGTSPVFTNPGFATDDIPSYAINGTYQTISKNGAVIFQAQVNDASGVPYDHQPAFASGLFGLGVLGTDGVQLVSEMLGGIQRTGTRNITMGVSLDQVLFKTT